MGNLRWVQLSEDERDELPRCGGVGALSFSTAPDDPPFLAPVSYGYDVESTSFYVRLAFPPGSGKAAVADGPVACTTCAETDDGRRSVVATGRLGEATDMPYESSVVQGLRAVRIQEVDIFDRPPEGIPFRRVRLRPETPTGRREVRTD